MKLQSCVLSVLLVLPSVGVCAKSDGDARVAKLYQRVTGVEARRADLEKFKGLDEASVFAKLFTDTHFIENRLANFVSKISNEEGEPFEQGDDFQTILSLAVIHDIPFIDVFSKPFFVQNPNGTPVIPARANHTGLVKARSTLEMLNEYHLNFSVARMWKRPRNEQILRRGETAPYTIEQMSTADGVYQDGIFSTNGFGLRNMQNSTNRRFVRASFDLFLCAKIDSWKDASLDGMYIGTDITRKPSDKVHVFESDCRSCHAPMDAMRGAAAYYNYSEQVESMEKLPRVAEKYNRNAATFVNGFETIDDSWENLLTSSVATARFGWRGPTNGKGLLSFSRMIANSRQFQSCMTRRLMSEFCDMTDDEVNKVAIEPAFNKLVEDFRTEGYKVKKHIQKIVTSNLCK